MIDPIDWYQEVAFTVTDLEPCAEYRFSIRGVTESGTEGPEVAEIAMGEFEGEKNGFLKITIKVIFLFLFFQDPSEPLNLKVDTVIGNEVSLCWEDPKMNPLCVDR